MNPNSPIEQNALNAISEVAAVLDAKGWAEGGGGNISVQLETNVIDGIPSKTLPCPGGLRALDGNVYAMTLSRSRMRELARQPRRHLGLVAVRDSAVALYLPQGREVSSELLTHLHAYASNGCHAVVHAHADYSSILSRLLSLSDIPGALRKAHTEVPYVLARGVSVVGLIAPGSRQLAEAVGKALSDSDAVLLERHGLIACGEDLMQALDRFEVIEKCSRLLYALKVVGLESDTTEWPDEFLP